MMLGPGCFPPKTLLCSTALTGDALGLSLAVARGAAALGGVEVVAVVVGALATSQQRHWKSSLHSPTTSVSSSPSSPPMLFGVLNQAIELPGWNQHPLGRSNSACRLIVLMCLPMISWTAFLHSSTVFSRFAHLGTSVTAVMWHLPSSVVVVAVVVVQVGRGPAEAWIVAASFCVCGGRAARACIRAPSILSRGTVPGPSCTMFGTRMPM
mmetsp:Transcript_99585/g.214859  ORF Transcript_99585/g.214859 Transcript_99585/m.214859 type:complete len:210 (-) Transcript_99585:1144-1773(-)